MSLQVLVRAPNGEVAGLVEPTETKAIPRYNDRGTWQLTSVRDDIPDELLEKGSSVVITDEFGHLISGPAYKYRIVRPKGSPVAAVTVMGYSDDEYLRRRLCFPDPAHDPTAQTAARRIVTGVTSTVLRTYVNENTGPGALTARRSGLVLEASDPLIGATITGTARFHNLLDELQVLALAGGGLGFRVTRTLTGAPTFEVYQPRDLTASIRLSHAMGSLESSDYELTAPEATYMVAGGQGELEDRLFKVAINTDDETNWGDRFEGFYDVRNEDDETKLQQDADTQLAEKGETGQISFVALDTREFQVRKDFGLGDQVTVEIEPGVRVAEVIREIEVTANQDGVVYTPRVGDTSATATPAERRAIRDALRRLQALETGA